MSNVHYLPTPDRPGLPDHLITVCPATHRRVVAALEAADEAVLAGWVVLADQLVAAARAEVRAVLAQVAA
jgi:hypothetical protein